MITGREPARISAMQRDKATSRIRTDDLCFTKALDSSVSADATKADESRAAVDAAVESENQSTDPDLSRLIDAWPGLPPVVRGRILGIVEATIVNNEGEA